MPQTRPSILPNCKDQSHFHLGRNLILEQYFAPWSVYRDICTQKNKQTSSYNNLYSIFCFSSFPSSDQIIRIPPREPFLARSFWTKWKCLPAECMWWSLRTACMQRPDCGLFWCALGKANASLVAGGLECAQRPSASTPGRAQNKDCVKFNSRRTIPKGSASSSPALVAVLNYKPLEVGVIIFFKAS